MSADAPTPVPTTAPRETQTPATGNPETIAEGLTRRKRTLGRNIERLMDARRMSYNDMARASRMSKTGIFKIVDGTSNASMESLFAIADFFGLTLNDLFTENADHAL